MKRSMNVWMIFAATVMLSTHVLAGGPCDSDMAKYCSSVAKGRPMVNCLSEHNAELSASCKDKYKDMKARMRHTFEACQDDAEKFCADVKPGAGALPKCLKSHESELTKACKDTISGKSRKRK